MTARSRLTVTRRSVFETATAKDAAKQDGALDAPVAGDCEAIAIEWLLPLRLASANAREHHHARARRVREQRSAAQATTLAKAGPAWGRITMSKAGRLSLAPHPNENRTLLVTITRIGPRALDSDNLAYSAKAVRDGIADAFGVDDGDEAAVRWSYSQERGAHGVRVRVVRGSHGEV